VLVVIGFALDDLGKGDILSDVGNLDGDPLTLFGIGNNDDEATLNTSDSITLVTNVLDFDASLFTFPNRWDTSSLLAL